MARGRDLTISILSDLDKFETSKAADEMEALGRSAQDMDDKIEQTAHKVDSAFEKIAASSKSNLRKVDDDARRAGDGMDDFKDEVHSTGREAAASFSGSMDDISDAVQEVAANALSAFGPAGALAGIAVASGIGALIAHLETAAEKANEAKESAAGLAQEIIDAGGRIDNVDLEGKIQEWSLAIADDVKWWEVWQKEAVTNVEKVQEAAEATGIATADMLRAMSGADPEESAKVLQMLSERQADLNKQVEAQQRIDSQMRGARGDKLSALLEERNATNDMVDSLQEQLKGQADALAMSKALTEATNTFGSANEDAVKAIETNIDALKRQEDAMSFYHETIALNEEVAASIMGKADAEEATAESIIKSLQETVAAQEQAEIDRLTIQRTYSDEALALIVASGESMGLTRAESMAKFLAADKKDRAAWVELARKSGFDAGEGAASNYASGIQNKEGTVRNAAAGVHEVASGVLEKGITVPVRVGSASGTYAARRQIERDLAGIVVVPTVSAPSLYRSRI